MTDLRVELPAELLERIAERAAELVLARLGQRGEAPAWLTVAETAHYLRVSRRHVERLLKRGLLPSTTVGRRRLIRRDDADRLAAAGGTAPTVQRPQGGTTMADRKRERARDSRGRPVPGLYVRDGRFIAGFKHDGRWLMMTLAAATLTEARRERERLLAELRERRRAAPDRSTFAEVFADWQAARTISERTRAYEREFVTRYLDDLYRRPVQELRPVDVARALWRLRDKGYAPLTRRHVYVLARGTFQHAIRRGLLVSNPCDGLAPQEVPTGAVKRPVAVLDRAELGRLVAAGSSERWRAALGLAAFAGLRLGELRALRWRDVNLKARLLYVRASAAPDGTLRPPKTKAGERAVPILPELRRLLVELRLRSPRSRAEDFVVGCASGRPVEERTLRRVLADAKATAGLHVGEKRLSWHSLRHSFCSMLATDLELPATTLARIAGHADAGFSLHVYAKDARDDAALAADVLARACRQG